MNESSPLQIPALLEQLIEEGRWPTKGEGPKQNSKSLVSAELIKLLAPEESKIYLYSPPFASVWAVCHSPHIGQFNFWLDPMSAPSEIDFELSLEIGDFGLGSDAPILLDYRESRDDPRVIRLRWGDDGAKHNHWVEMAPDFETFVRVLEL